MKNILYLQIVATEELQGIAVGFSSSNLYTKEKQKERRNKTHLQTFKYESPPSKWVREERKQERRKRYSTLPNTIFFQQVNIQRT